mmetsp:Transcript_3453/g.3012  ORF Transcript_3453/g.3012 Transcript_3453/m.3012 type:complete len:106 (+) Transcript_3453:31-348(+)
MLSNISKSTLALFLIGLGLICQMSSCSGSTLELNYQNLSLHHYCRRIWDYDSYLVFQDPMEDELIIYNYTDGSSFDFTETFYDATGCQKTSYNYINDNGKTFCEQ